MADMMELAFSVAAGDATTRALRAKEIAKTLSSRPTAMAYARMHINPERLEKECGNQPAPHVVGPAFLRTASKAGLTIEASPAVTKISPPPKRQKNKPLKPKSAMPLPKSKDLDHAVIPTHLHDAGAQNIVHLHDAGAQNIVHDHRPASRIRWKDGEIRAVAAMTANKMRAEKIRVIPQAGHGDRLGNTILLECVRSAQNQMLPKERRRYDLARANLPPLFFEVLGTLLRQHSPEPVAPAFTEEVAAKAAPAPGPAPLVVLPAAPRTPASNIFDGIPDGEIFSEAFRRFVALGANSAALKSMKELEDMQGVLIEDLDSQRKHLEHFGQRIGAMEDGLRAKIEEARKALPAVAIIGCMKSQFEELLQQVEGAGLHLNLKLYEQGGKVRPIHAQWAIRTRFAGEHGWLEEVRKAIPNGQSAFMETASISRMVAQLKVWFDS